MFQKPLNWGGMAVMEIIKISEDCYENVKNMTWKLEHMIRSSMMIGYDYDAAMLWKKKHLKKE